MALTYKIVKFETDENDSTKTMVGFDITDSNTGRVLAVDGSTTTEGKTDSQICTAAQASVQSSIDTWVSGIVNLGKTWNPDSSSIE